MVPTVAIPAGPKPTLSSLPFTVSMDKILVWATTYSVPHPFPSLLWPQSHSSTQPTHRVSPLQGHHGYNPFWPQTYSSLDPHLKVAMVTNQVAPSYPEPDLSPWFPCIPIETGPKPTQGQTPLHSTCSHIRSWPQTYSEPDPSPWSKTPISQEDSTVLRA